MHDILPDDTPVWQALEATVREVLGAYGFREIRVPILERTEVFTRAIGQATDVVEKEMYTFEDRNGDALSLRPEGTAGVVRAAIQGGLLYGQPQRLWYAGPMFRHERPQKGRTRQFHQFGAEVFGPAGPDVDAELLAMGERLWSRLGLSGIRLEINSLGTSGERAVYREQLVAYLTQHEDVLDAETLARLERNPLRVLDSKSGTVQSLLENAPQLPDFLGEESLRHFEGLTGLLDRLGIAYRVNPRLVRGLDYYCHTVFEWVTDDLGAQGTICAGGRYDGLIELQGGRPWKATGFAMGVERLVELMRLAGGERSAPLHAYMVLVGDAAYPEGLALAESLRNACPGLSIVCNPGGGSFKAQFKRADRSGAELALVIGEDELANGRVSIKFLREDRPQGDVDKDNITGWFSDWLADRNEAG
jgi:histidyl-tRNA synthetase